METNVTTSLSNGYNITETAKMDSFLSNLATVTGYTGFLVAFVNFFLFIFIARSIYRKRNSFHTQLLFVAFTDGFGGFSLFVVPQIFVDDYSSLIVCAVMYKLINTATCMSKGNMLCICFQRFMFSRKLGHSVQNWTNIHVASLVAANAVFGISALVITWPEIKVIDFMSESQPCSPHSLKLGTPRDLIVYVVLAIMSILPSDVFCLLTVRTLLNASNNIQPDNNAAVSNYSSTQAEEGLQRVTKRKQQHAINTILMILVVYTITSLPIIIASFLQVFGVPVTGSDLRICFLFDFATHIVNPFVIILRTRDVRNMVREDALQLWNRVSGIYQTN